MSEFDARETVPQRSEGAPGSRAAGQPVPRQVGPYRLLDELGAGGMGRVYRALHTRLKRVVALKLLPEGRVNSPEAVARFQHEMEAVGQLDHPNIVRATDAGEDRGHSFLVMEYVEGLDLDQLVRRCGPLPVAEACELVRQAAAGLQAAHERGLIHRDIKPSNIMLSRDGQVKVLDLGLARLAADEPGDERLTPSGQAMGTPDYMAPEQAFDARNADARADVYSLGCTLYKLLAGLPPFGGPAHSSRMKKLLAHAQQPVPPVREARPDVPPRLAAVLDRLLAKEPGRRFATAAEAARALELFAAGADFAGLIARAWEAGSSPADGAGPWSSAQVVTQPYRPPTDAEGRPASAAPPRRRRWRVLVGLLAALAALGLAAFALLPSRDRPPEEEPAPARERVLVPGRWYNLLERRPDEVFWRNPTGDHFWAHDPNRQEVRVSTRDIALLGLGKVSRTGYKIQLGLRQSHWTGGVGLFFGHRPARSRGLSGVQYQVLELRPYHGAPGKSNFALHRSRAFILSRPNGPPLFETHGVATAPLDRPPARDEQILEVRVSRASLVKVTWAGQDLTRLVTSDANARFTREDYLGEFGLYISGAEGAFPNARLMLFRED